MQREGYPMKPETKDDLAAMLKAAEQKIKHAEATMDELRAVQEKARAEANALRNVLSIIDPSAETLASASTAEPQRPAKFRDAIRDAVESSPTPVTIGGVVEHLKASGFGEEGASTPLPTRVGNELYKLAAVGEISRAARGQYTSKK